MKNMKRAAVLFFALIFALPFSLTAQTAEKSADPEPFFTKEEAPRLEKVLPPPPALDAPLFVNDLDRYNWGKEQRSTARGELAVEDAGINAAYFMARFSPAMGHGISPESNPILFKLLLRAHKTEQQAGSSAKHHFARKRPYQEFLEHTAVPDHENMNDLTSYPSGHTHASWLVGMILTAIDPDHTEDIMSVAYELGQSRVIVGFHYQSDVDAGRIAGSITFARLCSMPEFTEMLSAAAAEYRQ